MHSNTYARSLQAVCNCSASLATHAHYIWKRMLLGHHAPLSPWLVRQNALRKFTFLLRTLHPVSLKPHPHPGESSSTPPRGLTGQGDNNHHRSLMQRNTTRRFFCVFLEKCSYFRIIGSENYQVLTCKQTERKLNSFQGEYIHFTLRFLYHISQQTR